MSDSIKMLASSMVLRKRAGVDPYILFLGAGASISSGCSSMMQIVDDVLRNDSDFEKCKNDIEEATKQNEKFGIFVSNEIIKKKRTSFLIHGTYSILAHAFQYLENIYGKTKTLQKDITA